MSTMPEENQEQENINDQEQDDLAPEPESSYQGANESDGEPEQSAPNAGADERAEALQAELDQAKDQMLRAVAEAENTRKRLLREREDVRKYAIADFARDLLDFSDNFRRALDSIPAEAKEEELVKNVVSGVEAMEKSLIGTLEKHGITKNEPIDEMFDPNFHEAMFEAPGTGKPAGTVIEVIEPGYLLQDRLLRPARVGIAKDDGSAPPSPNEDPGSQVDMDA